MIKKILNFLNNRNLLQKLFLFIFVINFFLGVSLFNEIGLGKVGFHNPYNGETTFWKDFFSLDNNFFWWFISFACLMGFFIFNEKEK